MAISFFPTTKQIFNPIVKIQDNSEDVVKSNFRDLF